MAWRSSRFSRSSALIRSRSAVLKPSRSPLSRSCWRTHSRSVSGVQPIFAAIDWIADHCDPCSPRCSNTIRTARSPTSGEYRVYSLLIAPSSQRLEPPRKPGRFSAMSSSLSVSGSDTRLLTRRSSPSATAYSKSVIESTRIERGSIQPASVSCATPAESRVKISPSFGATMKAIERQQTVREQDQSVPHECGGHRETTSGATWDSGGHAAIDDQIGAGHIARLIGR
ncbi:hypothetical protein SAMN04488120_1233 [Fontimonas thermophila]|uniref:Uncharacterized protein n=1 Tax=Fontimonas thermophila TaxID=1076937 RepID=A0A1I2KLF2_9GAMM|nr:hypothetical protein SAMN04488120_1233 [Fontimonas thermophila]